MQTSDKSGAYALILGLILALSLAASPLLAEDLFPPPATLKLEFPASVAAEIPTSGVPAYARIDLITSDGYRVPNDGQWAAIVFYRDPACVPADFDLGGFFHFPGPFGPGAFACQLLTVGYELWTTGPQHLGGSDDAPQYIFSRNAVPNMPVWFAAWSELSELLDAAETAGLLMSDLEALTSLVKGQAWSFEEELYPHGGATVPAIRFRAEGRLKTGAGFSVKFHAQDAVGNFPAERSAQIEFHPPSPPHQSPPNLCHSHPGLPFC
jgi:hypothetical protein